MTSVWILLLSKYEFSSPRRPSSTCTSSFWSQLSGPCIFQWAPPPSLSGLHQWLKLSLSSNSCDVSKLHCLESLGSRKNEEGAKWWKQNISQGSYGYALPPGSSGWMGLSHSAAEGLSCWPPPLSVSEESLNLLPAITPLKVCLFAYKTHS